MSLLRDEAGRVRALAKVLRDVTERQLAHMNGHEAARRLRQELALENALLAAVSGYGQEDGRPIEAGSTATSASRTAGPP